MNWFDIAIAMLPEHLLLAGIVVAHRARDRRRAPAKRDAPAAVARRRDSRDRGRGVARRRPDSRSHAFPGHYSVSPTALLAKAIVLALAVPVLLISRDEFAERGVSHPAPVLALRRLPAAVADSFLTLFLGLELMSLPVYALVLLALPAAARAPRRRSSTWFWAAPQRRRC